MVLPSVRWSVRTAFFPNHRKCLFLAAEMDGIELVVTRGEKGGWDGGDGGDKGKGSGGDEG